MMLTIPSPRDLVRLAERGIGTLEQAIGLVPRLMAIVAEVEEVVGRITYLVAAIDTIEQRATAAVGEIEGIIARVDPLLSRFEPVLDTLEPMVERIADTTSPDEVEAVVRLVNHLPELVEKLDTDVIPMLDTLGSVSPDLRELLITSKELNDIIASIPGLGRMRHRVQLAERAQSRDGTADRSP